MIIYRTFRQFSTKHIKIDFLVFLQAAIKIKLPCFENTPYASFCAKFVQSNALFMATCYNYRHDKWLSCLMTSPKDREDVSAFGKSFLKHYYPTLSDGKESVTRGLRVNQSVWEAGVCHNKICVPVEAPDDRGKWWNTTEKSFIALVQTL